MDFDGGLSDDFARIRDSSDRPSAMFAMAGTVFLSYRHEDTAGYAGRLHDWLNSRFPNRIFTDVGTIAPGDNFVTAIEKGVGECKVLIALIGKQWLSGGRLQDPSDFVRIEIGSALRRGVRVIPVLVGGGSLPDPHDLPPDIVELCHRQAIVINDADWQASCERLTRTLESDLGHASSLPTSPRSWKLPAAALLLAAVAGAVTLYVLSGRSQPNVPQGNLLPVATSPVTPAVDSDAAASKSRLVGTWEANVVEMGIRMRIVWHVWPNGTSSYLFTAATGSATASTMWTYSDGVIYERPADGSPPSSASVEWIDADHFVLTIIDNGDPRTRGMKRRYSRL